MPEGTLVAFTGGKDFGDVTAIWHSLDSIKLKYEDMVLLHGGAVNPNRKLLTFANRKLLTSGLDSCPQTRCWGCRT